MGETRDLKQKIGALGNLQKVMQAMNQIASVKLRRLLPRVAALKRFDEALGVLGREVARGLSLEPTPFAPVRGAPSLVVVYSSDKGLCGPSNQLVLRALDERLAVWAQQGVAAEVVCLGAKVSKAARRLGYRVVAAPSSRQLAERLVAGQWGELWLIHNHFTSTLKQDCLVRRLFPQATATPDRPTPAFWESPDDGVKALAVWLARVAESAEAHARLSEHAARMTAMDSATRNARQLGERYHLEQNRARQASITSDLIEIISGKEALKRRRR